MSGDSKRKCDKNAVAPEDEKQNCRMWDFDNLSEENTYIKSIYFREAINVLSPIFVFGALSSASKMHFLGNMRSSFLGGASINVVRFLAPIIVFQKSCFLYVNDKLYSMHGKDHIFQFAKDINSLIGGLCSIEFILNWLDKKCIPYTEYETGVDVEFNEKENIVDQILSLENDEIDAKKKLLSLEKESVNLYKSKSILEKEEENLDRQIVLLKKRYADSEDRIIILRKQGDDSKIEILKLEKEGRDTEQELIILRKSGGDTEKAAVGLRKKGFDIRKEIEVLKSQINFTEHQIVFLEKQGDNMEEQIMFLHKQGNDSVAQVVISKERVEEIKKEILTLEKEGKDTDNKIVNLEKKGNNTSKKIFILKKQNKDEKEEILVLEKKIKDMGEEVIVLRKQNQDCVEKILFLENQSQDVIQKILILEDKEKKIEDMGGGWKFQIDNARKKINLLKKGKDEEQYNIHSLEKEDAKNNVISVIKNIMESEEGRHLFVHEAKEGEGGGYCPADEVSVLEYFFEKDTVVSGEAEEEIGEL